MPKQVSEVVVIDLPVTSCNILHLQPIRTQKEEIFFSVLKPDEGNHFFTLASDASLMHMV